MSAAVMTSGVMPATMSTAMSAVTMLGLCLAAKSECECGAETRADDVA